MKIQNQIEQKIKQSLNPQEFQILNESGNHNVPEGSESHFKLTLVSDQFAGITKVKRHQMVYSVLNEELSGPVHALALHLYSPQEWTDAVVPDSPKCHGGTGK